MWPLVNERPSQGLGGFLKPDRRILKKDFNQSLLQRLEDRYRQTGFKVGDGVPITRNGYKGLNHLCFEVLTPYKIQTPRKIIFMHSIHAVGMCRGNPAPGGNETLNCIMCER